MRMHFRTHPHSHSCAPGPFGGPGGPRGRGGHFGRGGRGGPGSPFDRGGRGLRIFDQGELRLVVLALIAESPRHGYDIIKAIEERLAGSYSPSPGVIYPTLTLLQELGQIAGEEHDGKKRYSITEEGRRHLAAHQQEVDAALARMKEVNARLGGGPAPQIIRAMENLRLALRLRMNRGPLSQAQIEAIAAALDAAAQAVERVAER